MTNTPRAQRIQSILDSRRPMAEKTRTAENTLVSAENALRQFRDFIPRFAEKLDGEAAQNIKALGADASTLISEIEKEKSNINLLSARFSRQTLNIGVAGRAQQGKSSLLQKLSGLSSAEIPSGNGQHCTGAPSVIVHEDINETYAEIKFHTEASFLEEVIAPFFDRFKWLGSSPISISDFFSKEIKPPVKSPTQAIDEEFIQRLVFLHENLPHYRQHLGAPTKTVKKEEIRSFIAQDDVNYNRSNKETGIPYCTWCAVSVAVIHCRFPHADLGAITLADTPGIGDFFSGAEDRLIKLIGNNLDSIIFVRKPDPKDAMIKLEDAGLHDVVRKAIQALDIESWTYFLINKNTSPEISGGNNVAIIPSYKTALAASSIRTKKTFITDVFNPAELEQTFNEFLSDIADNLGNLDQILFEKHSEGLRSIGAHINAFSIRAANALPGISVVAPDESKLLTLFNTLWTRVSNNLQNIVKEYKDSRDTPDEAFLATLREIFKALEAGPQLPGAAQIAEESAGPGLMKWQADKFHELRVRLANSFEGIDKCLDASFDQLRAKVLDVFESQNAGKLENVKSDAFANKWKELMDLWQGHFEQEIVTHAVELFLASGLSFRGFIQPRVRQALDVLDTSSKVAADFVFAPGDSIDEVIEKLTMAWEQATAVCREEMRRMAKEPSMARFAAVEDFVDAIVRQGGEQQAKDRWRLFYRELRSEIWKDDFAQLEADTRLRKDWDHAVASIQEAANLLGK